MMYTALKLLLVLATVALSSGYPRRKFVSDHGSQFEELMWPAYAEQSECPTAEISVTLSDGATAYVQYLLPEDVASVWYGIYLVEDSVDNNITFSIGIRYNLNELVLSNMVNGNWQSEIRPVFALDFDRRLATVKVVPNSGAGGYDLYINYAFVTTFIYRNDMTPDRVHKLVISQNAGCGNPVEIKEVLVV